MSSAKTISDLKLELEEAKEKAIHKFNISAREQSKGYWENLCCFVDTNDDDVNADDLYEYTKCWPEPFPTKKGMKDSLQYAKEQFGDYEFYIRMRIDWYEGPDCPPSGIDAFIDVQEKEL